MKHVPHDGLAGTFPAAPRKVQRDVMFEEMLRRHHRRAKAAGQS